MPTLEDWLVLKQRIGVLSKYYGDSKCIRAVGN